MSTRTSDLLRRAVIDRLRRVRPPWRGRRHAPTGTSLSVALAPWLVARLLVAGTLAALSVAVRELPSLPEPVRRHAGEGLLGWDAVRYVEIAVHGYEQLPLREVRFFPLVPLLVRWFDPVLPGGAGTALLVLANVAALVFTALVHRLVLHETKDDGAARRAAWLSALTPAGFVLVWGYTEALAGVLVAAALFAARTRRWGIAAAAAAAAGLARPVGVLLAVPLLIEALRRGERRPRAVLAALAPVAGTGVYLAWVHRQFGSALLPYTIQSTPEFRGSPTGGVATLAETTSALLRGDITVESVRVLWVVVAAATVVVLVRRWPASYGAFATVTLVIALGATRLGSFERYTLTTLPAALAVASVTARPTAERVALTVGAGSMAVYGMLALAGLYTP